MYREEQGRFERARLEAVLSTYRDRLREFDREHRKERDRELMKEFMASVKEAMRTPEDPADLARIRADYDRQGDVIYVSDFRVGERPPLARSRAEMEFAAQLEPCPSCGARELGSFVLLGSEISWQLDATCGQCGTKKTFSFTTRHGVDPLKDVPPVGELGTRASRQIKAEQFEEELARVWPHVDTDPSAWHIALICINELIKLAALEHRQEPWIEKREELMRMAP